MICKRRAQLVRHIGSEVAALLFGAFQFPRHAIKRLRQPAEIAGTLFRDVDVQIARSYGIGSIHQVGQRPGDVLKCMPSYPPSHQWKPHSQEQATDPDEDRHLAITGEPSRNKPGQRCYSSQDQQCHEAKNPGKAQEEKTPPEMSIIALMTGTCFGRCDVQEHSGLHDATSSAELVADAKDREDIARLGRVDLQLLAQVLDVRIDTAGITRHTPHRRVA